MKKIRHAAALLALTPGTHAYAADRPTAATQAAQARAKGALPTAANTDDAFARRGYLGTRADPVIRAADGRPVWNLDARSFLKGDAPATVNPSLWRHARLMALNGLFRVTDRIWQVRGFDLANITFVRGDIGWIVIDTLGSIETARAAIDLVTAKLGARPVTAIIYTHPHSDHFGGAAGLVTADDVRSGRVKVLAPRGFLASAIGENVIAGPAMQRRAMYQFGLGLPRDLTGVVNAGIGPDIATGTPSLIAPNREIAPEGETLTIDGVRMAFQFTRGTEAPVEMNIAFPDWKVVDMAENANATQHNILTPRGALVRDAKTWADALTESIDHFGNSEVLVTSHGWPRFGTADIRDYLGKQRDYYAYLHDQTVRLMNDGLTGDEIAAKLTLPPSLANEWYDRPYYGSLSFNARAVYQYYMGWYDANPVHLAPLPPVEAGRRYVAAMGGGAKVVAMAQTAFDAGDYTWAAELLNRAVFADPAAVDVRTLLARCYDQLGYQSESSLWRNMYLTGAEELRTGPHPLPRNAASASVSLAMALPTPQLFDLLAVRVDGEKAAGIDIALQFVFTDRGNERTYVTVKNGVLIHHGGSAPMRVDATLSASRADMAASLLTGTPLTAKLASGEARIDGKPGALQQFAALLTRPRPVFPIITPR